MECAKSISMPILRDVPCVLIVSVILFCSVVSREGVSKTCSPLTRIPNKKKRKRNETSIYSLTLILAKMTITEFTRIALFTIKNIGNICDILCAFNFKFKENFESCQNGLMLTCPILKMILEKKGECIDFTKTNAFKCEVICIQNV